MLAPLLQLGGTIASSIFGSNQANKQAKLQREFAQNGIQWRVEDAKKAGVHPLAALGFQGTSYSPVSVGTPDFGSAGAAIGNAIHKTSDPATRTAIDLSLEKAALENEHLRAQINAIRATRTQSPGIPSPETASDTGQPALIGPAPKHPGLRGGNTHYPLNSDAEDYQNRYGDVIENIAGARNFINDWAYTHHGIPFWAYMHLESQRRLHGRDYGRHYRHR